jgi:acyl-CoA dehydrogenase
MYFEMAARDIRALPKLEGTVHVNIALIVKFMPSFLFDPAPDYAEIPRREDAANDDFLFDQGPTRGLSKIKFHDYKAAFEGWDVPNVTLFAEQVETYKRCMAEATPSEAQRKDIDFLMGVGELFAQIVYAQLVLESARMSEIEDDVVDQIFDVLVRDFSQTAVELHGRPSSSEAQMRFCLEMVRKPVFDAERYERVWNEHVLPLNGAYEMSA